jgi:8-oxo-dGTP pyrophosphatase MutT (NUDIX family)
MMTTLNLSDEAVSHAHEGRTYVLGFLLDHTLEHVVLMEKRRPAAQLGKLNGCGGLVRPGESPRWAMAREAQEELGVRRNEWSVFARLDAGSARVYCFVMANENGFFQASTQTDERVLRVPCGWLLARQPRSAFPPPVPDVPALVALAQAVARDPLQPARIITEVALDTML